MTTPNTKIIGNYLNNTNITQDYRTHPKIAEGADELNGIRVFITLMERANGNKCAVMPYNSPVKNPHYGQLMMVA